MQAITSIFPGRRRQNRAPSSSTKMGAVNCRTMTLAAVVILLATEKSTLVPHTHSPPSRIQRFSRSLWRASSR